MVPEKLSREELERLASFPEQNPGPLVEVNRAGGLTYRNPAAHAAFPKLEAQGQAHPLLADLDTAWAAFDKEPERILVDELLVGQRSFRRRMRLVPGAGLLRMFLIDRTKRKRMDEMKDRFLQNVSHELRTPLTAIHQAVRLILDEVAGPCPPGHRRFLEIADRNIGHLRLMINDLIDTTRAETGKLLIEPRRMDLAALMGEVAATMRLMAEKKGIRLSCGDLKDLPALCADPVRVRQTLFNFIDNACKFTPAGGSVTLTAAASAGETGMVEIRVSDTGRGIPPQQTERIFDRLHQVRAEDSLLAGHKGLGLGLFISRQIVLRHGGRVWVESKLGAGTTFFFTLPALSLERLLRPALLEEGKPVPDFTLMTLEAFPARNSVGDSFLRPILLKARDILRRSVRIDDVVLPEMAPVEKEGLLFAVIRGDAKAAKAFIKRVQTLLLRTHQFKANKLRPKMLYTSMKFAQKKDLPPETAFCGAVEKIEALIQAAIARREVS